jgi:hypothetical protein
MWPDDTASDEPDFDFHAWAVAGGTKPPFDSCARSALECLAVSNDDLRSRLRAALFCLLYADPEKVPAIHRPAFDEIAEHVKTRLGDEQTYAGLKQFAQKLKLKSAKRLSRRVFRLCLAAA